ncbi:glycosyltransferase [Roseibium denhamense]|uniref:Glycosyl transferases group 1 n=1 Tax=Roseibium denhamense TaxID=76305 RepID=A0ABY1PI82_9HYPH|nr:glycosyltransferase family 4 protein [Roseibium denhamense]MTI05552.1 glycosyltransferase [Roseibium denhamense]SMP34977.1 Glycosyl transferases group 1 [Roseibium denhamense]
MPITAFAYPGDLNTPTGGYGYDRRIIAELEALGWPLQPVPLGEGFPFPAPGTLDEAKETLLSLPANSTIIVDGLAFGTMGDVAEAISERHRIVALVHHPLCMENGLPVDQARGLEHTEAKALSFADHVIVTSPGTAEQLGDLFNIPKSRITIALPGTDIPDVRAGRPGDMVRLLSVGTVVPRKGYDLLFDALADLKEYAWHLDVVGGVEAAPHCYEALKSQLHAAALTDRVTFHGSVVQEQLDAYYRSAHVFVLASQYEGYGMAFTEAIAYGLPVIGSGEGAVRGTLPKGAAIYCETGNVPAMKSALESLIVDRSQWHRLADAARKASADFPAWADTAKQFESVLKGYAV